MTSIRNSIQNVQNGFRRSPKWNKTIILKIVQYLWNRIKSLEMCSLRWFSRRGNHAPIWSSIVGNSVSSKRDNVLRSWPTRGFERVRLRKGHSKCYWNHAIFLRRTFTLIVIRYPFDTSDIYIYIYICRIRTYDGRLSPFLFVGLATVLLYCYLDMLNLYLTRSAIKPRVPVFLWEGKLYLERSLFLKG